MNYPKDDADEDVKNKAFDALQELVTNVQFANDEGDPGMGLELGKLDFLTAILHRGLRNFFFVRPHTFFSPYCIWTFIHLLFSFSNWNFFPFIFLVYLDFFPFFP